MELLCPAGTLPALKTAIDHGADAIYLGLKDDTNARHFAGLNFNEKRLEQGIAYAHQRGKRVQIAINTFAHPGAEKRWQYAVDAAVASGIDALILADIGVLDYAANRYPDAELHLSVQASATSADAIRMYQQQFGVQRVVLPRVLSIKQVKQLAQATDVELEVFAFGSLCIMSEGRCYLSSYMTGESPNTAGACSPAKFVRWESRDDQLDVRLNKVLIDRFGQDENAGYPTLCKGRFDVDGQRYHVLEEPTSLNTLELLPDLLQSGIAAVKIEGRQRSPAYVAKVTQVWREAIDQAKRVGKAYQPDPKGMAELSQLSEGYQTTLGPYHKAWQ
ncbi:MULTISPECIES: ubiquinone anaerobic biosynthesis protein UbiU [Corallincola]|uniref:Ubiquinone biosynthesis protein UbiU n=2 Tax=Corallincola TaxID=1775176 RepID=A0ABY1WS47_9GAMM|nr:MULTISPECIES: peptidase U32 family protein [Corallincola]TAA47572.1 U32 family peptidase [Corallincola spongiicola]TCI05254.1 U32 family peptidase [Corallincola luteus]